MKTSRKPPESLRDIERALIVPARDRHAVIDKFLQDAMESSVRTLTNHQREAMRDRTDRLAGIIIYFRHQVSFLTDLIARNNSSFAHESASRSRGRRRAKS